MNNKERKELKRKHKRSIAKRNKCKQALREANARHERERKEPVQVHSAYSSATKNQATSNVFDLKKFIGA